VQWSGKISEEWNAVTLDKSFGLPDTHIQMLAPAAELDFFDQQSVRLPKNLGATDAWINIISRPAPLLKMAFSIRDAVSALFGVKRIGGFTGQYPETVKVGDKLDFFLVEHVSPDVLTLTARDRHLDVMTCISLSHQVLTITSSVKTHNRFGRFYMLPVAPVHRLLVRSDLKRLRRALS
jgi:Protein of unknown function (DUF2867)